MLLIYDNNTFCCATLRSNHIDKKNRCRTSEMSKNWVFLLRTLLHESFVHEIYHKFTYKGTWPSFSSPLNKQIAILSQIFTKNAYYLIKSIVFGDFLVPISTHYVTFTYIENNNFYCLLCIYCFLSLSMACRAQINYFC